MTTFHPDGPHSPAQTIAAAEQVAHLLKYLNMATRSGQDGLGLPYHAYSLLGALTSVLERFPQLLAQVGGFVKEQAATGTLGDSEGHNPVLQAGMAADLLEDAANRIASAAGQIKMAQGDISGLYLKGDDDGE